MFKIEKSNNLSCGLKEEVKSMEADMSFSISSGESKMVVRWRLVVAPVAVVGGRAAVVVVVKLFRS